MGFEEGMARVIYPSMAIVAIWCTLAVIVDVFTIVVIGQWGISYFG
jgi:hypothetical protein